MKGPFDVFRGGLPLRLVAYCFLILVSALLVHLYVVYPLYIKRIPYFADAFLTSFNVQCEPSASPGLAGILKSGSLPYFSLSGSIAFIDKSGLSSSCDVHTDNELTNEMYRFASMTKVLTAFAVLDLVAEHNISIDDKLVEFFPEFNAANAQDQNVREVTLKQLLNHSSGFGGPFGSDNMIKQGETPWCPYDMTALESVRLAGKPGTNHLYSNVAYCLLGEVITRVSGFEYKEYIESRYLSGYPSLQFIEGDFLPSEPAYDFSNDYRFDKSYVSWLDFHAIAPAAGLMGKPEEFARLVWHLYRDNPDVLNAANLEQCREKGLDRCYSNTFVIHEGDNGIKVGVQQGYLPGASSLVAISSRGEVLVWTAPGAPLEAKYRDRMAGEVVKLLLDQHE